VNRILNNGQRAALQAWAGFRSTIVGALVVSAMIPAMAQAAITIPTTIDADGLATSTLASAAPVLVSLITASVVLTLVALAVRIVMRRVKRVGGAGG